MALKHKITKAEFDKLPADIQTEYTEKDGLYTLEVTGLDTSEDAGALRRAKEREVAARKEAEDRAKAAEDKLAGIDADAARKGGDIATLEKQWKEKADKEKQELTDKLDAKDKFISRSLVDTVATQIAAEISTSPAIIAPHIKARLAADLDGDEPKTTILDAKGVKSSLSLDDLKKEFVDNKDFAPIIRASKASGGGATGNKGQKRLSSASRQDGEKPKSLAAMDPTDLAAELKARKEAAE